jgi:Ran GTPase-activating protein (RanGAP) involved in mRNA processing and transport
VCDAGLRRLSAVLRDSQVLEVLQLQACGLESRHIVPLCAELSGAPIRLKELDLSANKIADEGLMALARVFAVDGVTLEMLDISGNALEEGGVAALAKALSASSGLKTVKLASHPLPIQAFKTGARVEMDGQKLTDFDVQFMATVLSASRAGNAQPHEVGTIPGMSLACNGLTEKGAAMLASALGSGRLRLLELNLRGNKVTLTLTLALALALTLALALALTLTPNPKPWPWPWPWP